MIWSVLSRCLCCPWTPWCLCSAAQPPVIWSARTRADAGTLTLPPRDVSKEKSCPPPSVQQLQSILAGRGASTALISLEAQDSRAAIQARTKNTGYRDHRRSFISGCGGNLYTSLGSDLSSSTSQESRNHFLTTR